MDISLLLEKYKKFLASDDQLKKAFQEALIEVFNVDKQVSVRVKNNSITFTAPTAFKSSVFRKKEELINVLNNKLGPNSIKDIR
jgi:hypothetical protein